MRASAAGRPEEVLELDPGASPKEVQTAWRDLSLALHPDKVRGALTADEATEAMKAVNHAKDVLLGNAPRPAAARPPPPTPTKPKKRPRAAPQPTPSKKKKAPAQRLDGAIVSLQRRTAFKDEKGWTARYKLKVEDPRWPGVRDVVFFDRSEATAELDFDDDGCLYALSGRVELNEWNGKKSLKVSDYDGKFALARRPGSRACLECDERIDDDEPKWKEICVKCWREQKKQASESG